MAEETITDTPQTDRNTQQQVQVSDWFAQAFWMEELAGLKLATQGRTVALIVVGVLLVFLMPAPAVYAYEAVIATFFGLGIAHYALRRSRFSQPWVGYLFVTLDFTLLAFTVVVLIPILEPPWTPSMVMRSGAFVYAYILLATIAFCYSPRLMLWSGLAGALAWSAGVVWVMAQPDTVVVLGRWQVAAEAYFNPNLLDLSVWIRDAVAQLVVAGLLAVVVWRSRLLVVRQAESARERTNLARYFPPTIVEQLAHLDEPLGAVRAQPVAVMFADIVGFTRMAEQMEPERIVGLLREFHSRLERAVFDNGGTLDKFLGDGVMATFGTPETSPQDAANAVASARAMLTAIDEWNKERAKAGQPPVQLSVGIHYGKVVLGNIGAERRLEFAVLGDTVNVASRLENLTRERACSAIVSDDLVQAVRCQTDERSEVLLAGFRKEEAQELRGRQSLLGVWTLAANLS
jgi:adenylate cyclase